MADKKVKFEDKESLRRKNKTKAFYPYIKYSFVAVAACFILFIFVSKLFIKPLDNTTIKTYDKVMVQNTSNSSSSIPSSQSKTNKENTVKKQKPVFKNNTKTIAKAEKPQEKEIPIEVKEEVKPESNELLADNMIVMEVNNLISYTQEEDLNEKEIIELDNFVLNNDIQTNNNDDVQTINPLLSPLINNKYVYQLRHNLESTIEKAQDGVNYALDFIEDNIKYNPFESIIAKK